MMKPTTSIERPWRTLLTLILSVASTTLVQGSSSPQSDNDTNDSMSSLIHRYHNDTSSSGFPLDSKDQNKAATVFLTFSLLFGFALFGLNLRQKSFRRIENLSAYRRGTYEGVSLLELPPGDYNTSGTASGTATENDDDKEGEEKDANNSQPQEQEEPKI
ncbi:expressed unknown protein [Seminavis robusta]|uniref:Uncharacterized protein n=1 Tax=Seminavis robusta TaxID=568900 RepID=A0A9N8HBC2_9STRA|nr:expressed unknown protein [Seminavis robusta]|eukprot:Sro356_g125250.1 n/a (160) ;mRNA; f:11926-12405